MTVSGDETVSVVVYGSNSLTSSESKLSSTGDGIALALVWIISGILMVSSGSLSNDMDLLNVAHAASEFLLGAALTNSEFLLELSTAASELLRALTLAARD